MIDPMPKQDVKLPPPKGFVSIDAYNAAIASARAQALKEAAGLVDNSPIWKFGPPGARDEIATAIRALSARPDTTGPVIEVAKAVVANPRIRAVIVELDGGDDLDRLAAAIAAHEGRHE